MSIRAIGTDVVAIQRMRELLSRYGERLARRILSDREFASLPGDAEGQASFLARRFAAKEAAAKALGTGIARGVRFGDLETVHEPTGQPRLVLSGGAAQRAHELEVANCHLSLSDEREYALAFVILETANR